MSMHIMRNEAHSQTAINAYKENRTHAEKVHEKLASGLKIVNAKDNSSGYAISERMRNLIRAFSQNHENIQNDSALIRTAERGISQIVDNLRTMKELAINSANDSNTDEDRRVLQKEFAQRMETINDIVDGTEYNGKKLLDGTWTDLGLKILQEFNRSIPIDRLVVNFAAGENTDTTSSLQSYGDTRLWATGADVGFRASVGSTHEVILDFSGVQRKYGYAYMLHNQGFTLLCGGCAQYVNIRFNANVTANQSEFDGTANEKTIPVWDSENQRYVDTTYTNDMAGELIIGIKGVKNSDELAQAVFDGVKALQGNGVRTSYAVTFDGKSNTAYLTGSNPSGKRTISSNFTNTENEVLLDANHNLTIGKNSDGNIFIRQRTGTSLLFKAGLIPNSNIKDLPAADLPNIYYQPLWAQHGSEAGQRFHMYINDLRTSSLGLDNTNVTTASHARSAIGHVETALEIALEEASNMGAYLQRLDVTHLNLSTLSENVQASESTVRDADMAKEMVDFTRYRILSRSSQAMVSQANHNEQSVLGLLR